MRGRRREGPAPLSTRKRLLHRPRPSRKPGKEPVRRLQLFSRPLRPHGPTLDHVRSLDPWRDEIPGRVVPVRLRALDPEYRLPVRAQGACRGELSRPSSSDAITISSITMSPFPKILHPHFAALRKEDPAGWVEPVPQDAPQTR